MFSLDGKVAVITGGTSGIGARSAEVFVAQGAKVVIAGRRQGRGERLVQTLGQAASYNQQRAIMLLKNKILIQRMAKLKEDLSRLGMNT